MATDNTNRAPAPSRARRYLAALTLARPYHPDDMPMRLHLDIEALLAIEAADCGNSIPGEIERRVESYLEERGVVVTEHGAAWTRPPAQYPCAKCAYLRLPTDGHDTLCAASESAIPSLHSVPINCPLNEDGNE